MANRKGSFIAGTFVRGGPEQAEGDVERMELALGFAEKLSRQQGWKTVWLISDTAGGLGYAELRAALSPQHIKALKAKRPISRDGATELRHATKATMHGPGVRNAIVALRPSAQLLNLLDEHREGHVLIVVPWEGDHFPVWAETWGAMNLVDQQYFERPMIDDKAVRDALNDLVNVSVHGGLTYPSDLPMFRTLFKRLKQEGHRFTTSSVRSFVIVESNRGVAVADKIARAAAPYAVSES
jgi:hypothetical protein